MAEPATPPEATVGPAPAAMEPEPTPPPGDVVGSDDYELTNSDCDALARAYGQAWVNDELAKLADKKLDAASHEEATAEIEASGREMRDNWLAECGKTVGTPYRHENLACAIKATTMKAFDDCWYGR